MILDRLVIAGLTWTGRTLFGSKMSRRRTDEPGRMASPAPKRGATMRQAAGEATPRDSAPAETQQVVGPDQDMLDSLNFDESMGFRGSR